MPDARDIFGQAFKDGAATLLARVVGHDGQPLVPAQVTAAAYSVYLLDDENADTRTPVPGHADVSLEPAAVLFAALQLDALWTVDAVGYNFRHTPDVSQDAAFPVAGRRCLVEYRLTPAAGPPIVIRFRINVI